MDKSNIEAFLGLTLVTSPVGLLTLVAVVPALIMAYRDKCRTDPPKENERLPFWLHVLWPAGVVGILPPFAKFVGETELAVLWTLALPALSVIVAFGPSLLRRTAARTGWQAAILGIVPTVGTYVAWGCYGEDLGKNLGDRALVVIGAFPLWWAATFSCFGISLIQGLKPKKIETDDD